MPYIKVSTYGEGLISMDDVKDRYVSALRSTKDQVRQAKEAATRTAEEQRIFDAFRRNAREDYRTLKSPAQRR